MNVIIVEGVDRVVKTTCLNKIKEKLTKNYIQYEFKDFNEAKRIKVTIVILLNLLILLFKGNSK